MSRTVLYIFLINTFISLQWVRAQKPAYELYDNKGKEITFDKLVNKVKKADIIFFGELHSDPLAHWLELELTKELYQLKNTNLVLAAEMFESDNQLILDEYLDGLITEKSFEDEARLWQNYKTDYKPLVSFAKENGLSFIATNIPRRYASLVANEGFEGLTRLSADALQYIAPLPVDYDPDLEGYKKMLEMSHMGGMKANENFPKAQAIKDATMAHFILKNRNRNDLVLHFNGSYHSENHEGIVWYIKKQKPGLNIITISTVQQKDVLKPDESVFDKADYILVTPSSMTQTY